MLELRNKKGFTMIEVLSVVIIFGLILMISLPLSRKMLNDQKQDNYDTQINNIKLSAQNWAVDNLATISKDGEKITITLSQLKADGYIGKSIKNPLTGANFANDMEIVIEKTGKSSEVTVKAETGTNNGDFTSGVITYVLMGEVIEDVKVGESYVEKGITFYNVDGNVISHEAKIFDGATQVGSLETTIKKTYTIEYTAGVSPNVIKVIRTVNVINNEFPDAPIFTPNITVPTNTDVSVSIAYSLDSTVREYKIGTGSWSSYISPIILSSNNNIYARARNAQGYYSNEVAIIVNNIDKIPPIAPTLIQSPITLTNTDVAVTITYSADSTVKEYRVGAGGWVSYLSELAIVNNATVYARGRDAAGNYSTETPLIISNIDKTPPVAPTLSQTPTASTNGNVTLTITYSGDSSTREYRIGAGGWTTYTAPITITSNNMVYARGRDAAGNYSSEGSINITNIDKTPPAAPTSVQSPTALTNGNVILTITYSGDSATREYRIGAGAWTPYTAAVTITDNATVYARGRDTALNYSNEVAFIINNIDKTPPTVPTLVQSPTGITNGNVTVTITYSGDSATREYKIGAGAWTPYTAAVTVTDNAIVYARGRDAALNYSTEGLINITNIDKTPPTVPTLVQSPTTPTNGNVTLTITYSGDSATREYKIGAGAWTTYTSALTITDNATVYARGRDTALNYSSEGSISITNIDRTPPANPSLAQNISVPTNTDVIVTITYSGDSSTREYRIGAGPWTAYSSAVTLTANNTVYARGLDAAGNYSSTISTIVNNIDKDLPNAPTLAQTPVAPTNGNVSVIITYSADSTLREYRVGAGAWTTYTAALTITDNTTVYARGRDEALNYSSQGIINITNIDRTPPANPTFSQTPSAMTNGNVTLTITYSGDSSVKEYRIGAGGWATYTGALTITDNATVYARGQDAALNYSSEVATVINNIDKIPPATPTLTHSPTTPTNSNVTVTITYSGDSVVREYRIGAGAWTAYTGGVVISENNTVYARGRDAVGNYSIEGSLNVVNIDTTPPATPTLVQSPTGITNTDVIVTITYSGDSTIREYKIGAGAWTAYSSALTLTSNNTVYARGRDAAGNYSIEGIINVTNIDKTPPANPTLVQTPTTPTNGNVTVTITYSGDSTAREYKIGVGAWTAYTAALTITDNAIVYARGRDAATNSSSEVSLIVNNIDRTPPTTPTLSQSPTPPTNGNVTVTITYSGDSSGREYKIGAGAWTAYTAALTLTNNDTVYARGQDAAGNYSSQGSISVTNIDKTPPAAPTLGQSPTTPTNSNVTVTITYSGDSTGREYRIDSGSWTPYTAPIVVASNMTVHARGLDAAGNYSFEANIGISNIDKTAPANPSIGLSPTTPTNGNVTATVTYSGDSTIREYKVDSGAWTAYTAPLVFNINGTLYARGQDNAGNYSGEVAAIVNNIDKTPPTTPTLIQNPTTPINGNVTVTITYSGDSSTTQYKIGAGAWQTYTGPVAVVNNAVVYARGIDAAGNFSSEGSINVTNIDRSIPATPTFVQSPTTPTPGNVSLTITYSGDSVTREYRIGAGAWTNYTAPVTITDNATVYARGRNAALTYSTEGSISIANIDRTPPANPTLTQDISVPTNTNVIVTITYSGDSTTREYKIGAGAWTAYSSAITITDNATVYARGRDVAGNYSSEVAYIINNIDRNLPASPSLVQSPTTPTNSSVTVTITYSGDSTLREYRIGAGAWTTYTSAVTILSNNTVYARGRDAALNYSIEGAVNVTNIDTTPPTNPSIGLSPATPTNGNVTATVTYSGDSTIREYKVDSGAWTAYTAPLVFNINGTLYARGRDAAGNYSSEVASIVNNIDRTAPTVPTLSQTPTGATNGNVTVTITYSGDSSGKEYKVGAGPWTAYTAALTITANNTVYARGQDSAGNYSSEGSINITNIDKTTPATPTLSQSPTTPTNGNVTLTITYSGDSTTREYRIGAGAWTAYTAALTITDNNTVYARGRNSAGTYSLEGSIGITNIDRTPPANPSFSQTPTTPTTGNVSVTITYSGDSSTAEYRVGAGAWTNYTGPVTITDNNTVYARGRDLAGNYSSEVASIVNNIDRTPPTAPTLSQNPTGVTNGNVSVTITYSGDSAVAEYRVGAGGWTTYSGAVTITYNETVWARGRDVAGNYSSEGIINVTNIDKTPPATPTLSQTPTTPTNGNVTVTITYSGDSTLREYRIGAGAWTAYTAALTITDNNTVYARGRDAAGNYSSEGSIAITNIDRTPPANPSLSPNISVPTNGNVVVTITYSGDSTGREYRIGAGAWTTYASALTLTTNDTVYARANDAAGNYSSTMSIIVNNIDKTAPSAPTLVQTPTGWTNGNVTVTITYSGDSIGKEYRIGAGAWTAYSSALTITSNNTVYARGLDAASNYSIEGAINITNIDKTAPANPTFSQTPTGLTNGNVSLTITYSGDSIGREYKIGAGAWTAYSSALTITANDTVYARGYDSAGNYSGEVATIINNIDKTPPTIPTLAQTPTTPTNGNVTVTITYSGDSTGREYKIGAGAWTAYSSVVTITANNTIYARGYDAAGNYSGEGSISVTNIDKTAPTAPTLSQTPTVLTTGNVTVTITYSGDSTLREYRIGAGVWTTYTSAVTVTSNNTVYARGRDDAGNYSSEGSISVTNIDKTPPANPTFVQNPTGSTSGNVTVTITYSGDSATRQYRIGAGAWTTYTGPLTISTNDTIYARAYDSVGNVSSTTSIIINNISAGTPPVITFTVIQNNDCSLIVRSDVSSSGPLTSVEWQIEHVHWATEVPSGPGPFWHTFLSAPYNVEWFDPGHLFIYIRATNSGGTTIQASPKYGSVAVPGTC